MGVLEAGKYFSCNIQKRDVKSSAYHLYKVPLNFNSLFLRFYVFQLCLDF